MTRLPAAGRSETLSISLLVALFGLTGCPALTGVGDDDDSIGDDDDSAGDDDDAADDDDSAATETCEPAVAIACGDTLAGTTVGGTSNVSDWGCPDSDFALDGPEAFFEFASTVTGTVRVTMTHDDGLLEDLDLLVVGASGGDCDSSACQGSSHDISGTEVVEFDAAEGASYYFAVDGFDGSADGFSIELDCDPAPPVEYPYVVIRSRTETQADLDNNTPGPDIDAVELFTLDGSFWADDIWAAPGEFGANGNANNDAATVLDESDAFVDQKDGGVQCILDDDASGNAKFMSMGGGDTSLGAVGWLTVTFEEGRTVETDDLLGIYEVGADDCDNVGTARDDEYEVYLCNDDFDPDIATLLDVQGDTCISQGTTEQGGGIFDFFIDLD